MKTAFISGAPANIARVFGDEETARLAAHSDLLPGVRQSKFVACMCSVLHNCISRIL